MARRGAAWDGDGFPIDSKEELLGITLEKSLAGLTEGGIAHFWEPLKVAGRSFTHATVLRDYGTGSRARLLRMSPGDALFVCKLKDLRREHAIMCAIRQMNRRWRERKICVLGEPVQAVTYDIYPLGSTAGLVEFVGESSTFFELSQRCAVGERHLRVLRALKCDPGRLCRLAATTAAHLTMGYALGIRDGHDDNLMLRTDGSFFRVDFEFAFGKTPEVDAPGVFVPRSLAFALGGRRWEAVVDGCGRALEALSAHDVRTVGFICTSLATSHSSDLEREGQPPAWDLLRIVPELAPLLPEARAYARRLSFQAFSREVKQADQWSFSRATKNSIREAMRYLAQEAEAVQCISASSNRRKPKEWRSVLELLMGHAPRKDLGKVVREDVI